MKRLQRLGWVSVVAFGFNAMAWAGIEGCSGDDSKADAGDSSPEDHSIPDVKDSGPGQDVQPDVQPDVKDAGPDVTAVIAFQQAYAEALCKRFDKCCYGAQLDASAGDAGIATCEANVKSANFGGIEFAIGELDRQATLFSGHIDVNQTAASSCLAALSTLTCGAITGTEYTSMVKNCLGALTGNLPVGQTGCRGSVECNNGFCAAPDGGFAADASGTCVPIAAVGSACDPTGNGNDECMYRSWLGTQQARCDIVEATSPACGTTGTPTFKCTAKTANSGACLFEWECASGTCGDTCSCIPATSTWTYPFAGVCQTAFGADSGLN